MRLLRRLIAVVFATSLLSAAAPVDDDHYEYDENLLLKTLPGNSVYVRTARE